MTARKKKDDSPVSPVGEEKVVWSDEYVGIYTDELNSTEFKECLEKSKDAMETDVNGSVDYLDKCPIWSRCLYDQINR